MLSCFSGFINATEAVHHSVPVGAMMYVSGGLFLAGVIVDCFLLVRVRLEWCTVHISSDVPDHIFTWNYLERLIS